MSDEGQIDYTISEVLGAWQVADVEKLHKDYADDVTVVNGAYAPPIIGWNNYLAVYQQQRARMQQVRMDRSNTVIKVAGPVAWACLSVGFCGYGRRCADRSSRTDHVNLREEKQSLDYRAQPHFHGAATKSDRQRQHAGHTVTQSARLQQASLKPTPEHSSGPKHLN